MLLKCFNHHLLITLGVNDVNCPISACEYIYKENSVPNQILLKGFVVVVVVFALGRAAKSTHKK